MEEILKYPVGGNVNTFSQRFDLKEASSSSSKRSSLTVVKSGAEIMSSLKKINHSEVLHGSVFSGHGKNMALWQLSMKEKNI